MDLLARFLDKRIAQLKSNGIKSSYAVFIEPLIDSGYPDAVLIRYDKQVLRDWRTSRASLSSDDLRLLAYLQKRQTTTRDEAATVLGFEQREVERSFNLLMECNMAQISRNRWRAVRKREYLGIHTITSIEAKMSAAQTALYQATSNMRFANESYVLLGSNRVVKKTEDAFRRRGVGLIAGDCKTKLVEPAKGSLPVTHVMLQFNEWIGRCIALGVIA